MGDRLQSHVLCGLCGKRRAQAAGAVEDELLVFLEDRFRIGALRIDPELTTFLSPTSLIASAALMVSISTLASSIMALMPRWMVWGKCISLVLPVIPGRCEASNPESRADHFRQLRDSGFALTRAPE
jgi:hypothetical protein